MKAYDFDNPTWIKALSVRLDDLVTNEILRNVAESDAEFREDYVDKLFEYVDEGEIYLRIGNWVAANFFKIFHATRLNGAELEAVKKNGLTAKEHLTWVELQRTLNETIGPSRAASKAGELNASIHQHLGRDRGKVFLGLSRKFLRSRCASHYLYYGSEFAQCVFTDIQVFGAKNTYRLSRKPYFVEYIVEGSLLTKKSSLEVSSQEVLSESDFQLEKNVLTMWLVNECDIIRLQDYRPHLDYCVSFPTDDLRSMSPPTIHSVAEVDIEKPYC